MKYIFFILFPLYLLGFSACNTTRFVKPLKQKEVAVGLDFGGPLINFGKAKIPVPFSSVAVGYGVDSTFTVFGGLHITALAFGTAQLDLGITKQVLAPQKGWIPGISLSPKLNLMADVFKGNFRIYPELGSNFYWKYLKKQDHFFYLAVASWFDFWPTQKGLPKQYLHPVFALGHTFENAKMRYTVEAKLIGVNSSNKGGPIQFNGIGDRGTWGFYISVFRKF